MTNTHIPKRRQEFGGVPAQRKQASVGVAFGGVVYGYKTQLVGRLKQLCKQ